MANFEAQIENSFKTIDQELEKYKQAIHDVFDIVDADLVAFGRSTIPGYRGIPKQGAMSARQRKTAAALLRFRTSPDEDKYPRQSYTIRPGEIGPPPEELEVGEIYQLHGFATTDLPCCSPLAEASMSLILEGKLEFGDAYGLTALDGEDYRFIGYHQGKCEGCGDTTPYLSFNRLLPNGQAEQGAYFIPVVYAALEDMVTIAS